MNQCPAKTYAECLVEAFGLDRARRLVNEAQAKFKYNTQQHDYWSTVHRYLRLDQKVALAFLRKELGKLGWWAQYDEDKGTATISAEQFR